MQHFEKLAHILEVQAGGRLVEDVERAAGGAARQLLGELHALGLTARKSGRLLADMDVAEADLLQTVAALPADAKERIIADYLGERSNRRHKPGRAFERADYLFELCVNIGEYRDLQRHRICSPMRQQFSTVIGYDINPDIAAVAQIKAMYEQAMERADALFRRLVTDYPAEAQYVVPMGYRVRYSLQLNLREAYHLIELRSGEQGHRDYRRTAQAMYEAIKAVHPELVRGMTFVNLTPDIAMGRLRAEMRSARKRLSQA